MLDLTIANFELYHKKTSHYQPNNIILCIIVANNYRVFHYTEHTGMFVTDQHRYLSY